VIKRSGVITLRQKAVYVEVGAELEMSDELGVDVANDGVGVMKEPVVVGETTSEDDPGVDEETLLDSDECVAIGADGVEEINLEKLEMTDVEMSMAVLVGEVVIDRVHESLGAEVAREPEGSVTVRIVEDSDTDWLADGVADSLAETVANPLEEGEATDVLKADSKIDVVDEIDTDPKINRVAEETDEDDWAADALEEDSLADALDDEDEAGLLEDNSVAEVLKEEDLLGVDNAEDDIRVDEVEIEISTLEEMVKGAVEDELD
jgi:hypothetical protein